MIGFSTLLQGLGVFLATALASMLWALYFRYSTEGKPHRAAFADLGIILISAFNIVSYTENRWMLIPVLLGTYVGTVSAIQYKLKKERAQEEELFNENWARQIETR